MNKMLLLARVLLKTNFKFNKKTVAIGLIVVLSMMPLAGIVWGMVWGAYDIMASVGQQGLILWFAVSIVSLLTFFLGIFYIMGIFFYSDDIELLLPLPFKPWQILGAKLATVLIYEYLTQMVFFLPVLIAYGIKDKASVGYVIMGLAAYLIFPIIPLVFASLIDIFVIRSFRFVKNKDRMKTISGVMAMIIAIGFNLLMQNFTQAMTNPEDIMMIIQQGNNSVLGKAQDIFIVNKFMTLALTNHSDFLYSAANMLIAIAGAGIFLGIFLYLGDRLYLKSVVGLTEAASTKKTKATKANLYKSKNHLIAFCIKELKLLFRTPVYFLNCVLTNFLWPAFILIPIFTKGGEINQIRSVAAQLNNPNILRYAIAGVTSAALFISGTNMISSTAISREGKNLYVSKYLPVNYKAIINAKVMAGTIMGLAGILIGLTVVWILFSLPVYMVLMAFIISLPSAVFINYLGILLDLKFPKLNWDNEQKAVKQNINGVLIMFMSIAFGFLNFVPLFLLNLGYKEIFIGLFAFYSLFDILIFRIAAYRGSRWFDEL